MRKLAVALVCLFAMFAGAQEAPVDAVAEVVKTPIEPQEVPAPNAPLRNFSANVDATPGFQDMLTRAQLKSAAVNLGPDRVQQCQDAKQFVLANAPTAPQSEAVLTKASVLDACYNPPPDLQAAFAPPPEDTPPALSETGSPLRTSQGVPLDLSQRAVLALTIIAVNTAKEAIINEGLGAFAKLICDDDSLKPYFNRTCAVIVVGSVTRGGQQVPLRTLTLKQIGSQLQDAMRADVDDALPTLIADLSVRLDANEQALLPFVALAVDTLRTGDDANKGRVLARNILSNVRCQSSDVGQVNRCALVQLLATSAATSLDAGCTDATTCRDAFLDVVSAEALKRLQDWGVANNVTIPLPTPPNRFEVGPLLNALSAADRDKLQQSTAFKTLVLWNGTEFNAQVYEDLAMFVQANRPSTPTFSGYFDLLESSLTFLEKEPNTGIPADAFTAIRTTLLRVNPRITRTIDLALLAYRSAQAFKRGSNILTVTTEAALRTPCDRDRLDEVACGFRFTGVVLASIVNAEKTLSRRLDLNNQDDRKSFVKLVITDLRKRLAEPEHMGVEKWVTDRFLAYRANFDSFADGLVQRCVTLEASVERLRELEKILTPDASQTQALDEASKNVVADGFQLVKSSLELLPMDPAFRDRTISVIGYVETGWVAIQKKDYGQVLNATLALASEVCVPDSAASSHINKIVNTIAAYRPLIEAFTAAETKEEFQTAVENFIDTAPTAIDLQQFPRSSALSMYVGGAAGMAWLSDENGGDRGGVANLAPYVPVGIEYSWKKTWGAMLSLLDVGAVASLYVRSGESTVPEARLSNVFSPGLIVRKSWVGKPYAWGLSASMVPDVGGSRERAPRVAFFVAYQRPLLRIFPVTPTAVGRSSNICP